MAMQANRAFDSGSKLRSIPRYRKEELQALIEYGVTDWFTAMFQPSLQHVDIAAPFAAHAPALAIPTSAAGRGSGPMPPGYFPRRPLSGYPVSTTSPIRRRSDIPILEIDVRGLAGYSFKAGTLPAFVDLEVAQRFRLGGPPDEFRTDMTFGIRPADRWLLLAQSFNVVSEGAGTWGFGELCLPQISAQRGL